MNSTEILEGNKLIAIFMGKVPCNYMPIYYHSSWDWLMPVIDKIEHLYEDKYSLPRFEINSHHCDFSISKPFKSWIVGSYIKSPEKVKANSKIEAAWMVAVEFIKYHNKQKQQ